MASRPVVEQEADLFAAALLMPKDVLTAEVIKRFGGPIERHHQRESLSQWLCARGHKLTPFAVTHSIKLTELAFHVADANWFDGNHFVPLNQRFGVSPTAMAIQLVQLGLVA